MGGTAARSTGYDDGWALVRGNASYDKRQSCAVFRDRIAKVEEKLQSLAGPRWIARPLQVQPNLTCAFPRQARSPPHVQLLPTGKRQWRVRHGGASTINRHTLPCAVPLESTEHRKIVICRTAGEQLLPGLDAIDRWCAIQFANPAVDQVLTKDTMGHDQRWLVLGGSVLQLGWTAQDSQHTLAPSTSR